MQVDGGEEKCCVLTIEMSLKVHMYNFKVNGYTFGESNLPQVSVLRLFSIGFNS